MKGWLLDTNVVSELRRPRPDGNVLAFKYSTDAASFITAIPTYNNKMEQRNDKAFVMYTAIPYTSHASAAAHVQAVDDDALTPVYCYA